MITLNTAREILPSLKSALKSGETCWIATSAGSFEVIVSGERWVDGKLTFTIEPLNDRDPQATLAFG